MIADLRSYPEYKESGLPWIGQVPGHWDVRPAFGAFVPNHQRNNGMKEKTVLSLTGQADVANMARKFLRDPYWPLRAARELGSPVPWPVQYVRAAPHGTKARVPAKS